MSASHGIGLRIFVCRDEGGKVAAVFEQQRRGRRRRADMEARHGAEELDAGDALHRRIDRGQRIDQADRDVVAVDIVALVRRLAARAGDERPASRASGFEQGRCETGGVRRLRPLGCGSRSMASSSSASAWRSRMACAAAASAFRIGHSGISLSHSISVGIGPAPADDDLVELPDRVGDRPVMAVDQQRVAFVVGLLGMSGEMDLADLRQREIGEIVERREAVVGRRDEDIVDVEQQAAAGARARPRG